MPNTLSVLDTVIVLAYISVIFAVGIYAWITQRKQDCNNQAESYFLASRDMLWPVVGATLFSSNIGAEHFVGLSGSAAKSGIAVGAWEWTAPFLILIQGFFVAPIFISAKIVTTPQYLELRFNRAVRVYNAFITLVTYVFIVISSTLYAGAVILQTIVGWDLYVSSLALIVATGVYSVLGGLRAVVWTENVQIVILCIGGFVLMAYSLSAVGGLSGIYAKQDQFPPQYRSEYMHIFRPYDDADWPWPGVTFGILAQSYYYWNGNHLTIQRVLSSKSALHAKYGAITASVLKILPVWMMCIPGMCAPLLYPEDFADGSHQQYDRAYPLMVIRMLPNGLIGLLLAAMLSALMSSLAAVFNSAATIITNDIYKLLFPHSTANDAKLVFIARVGACVFVCISVLWLPVIQHGTTELFAYSTVSAYLQNPLSVIYFFGAFWDRANVAGAYCAILFGFVAGGLRFLLSFVFTEYCSSTVFCSSNFLYFGLFLFGTCSLLMICASLLTGKPSEEKIYGLTYWSLQKIKRQKHSKTFERLIDDLEERKVNVESNAVQRSRCWKLIYLDGDENSGWFKIASIPFTIVSLVGLLACWVVFF